LTNDGRQRTHLEVNGGQFLSGGNEINLVVALKTLKAIIKVE